MLVNGFMLEILVVLYFVWFDECVNLIVLVCGVMVEVFD